MRRINTGRRAEGHVEYAAISLLIMVCAIVGLYSFIHDVRNIAGGMNLCIDCPEGTNPAGSHDLDDPLKNLGADNDAGPTGTGTGDGTWDPTADNPESTVVASTAPPPEPTWMESFLGNIAYFGKWLTGSGYLYDILGIGGSSEPDVQVA